MVPTFKCQYLDVITGWWVWCDIIQALQEDPWAESNPPNYNYRIRNMQQGRKEREGEKPKAQAGHLLLLSELPDRSFYKTLIYISALLVLRVSLGWCAYVFWCQISFWCVVAWNLISMTLMALKSETVSKSKRPKGYIFCYFIIL